MKKTRLWTLAAIVKHIGKAVSNENADQFMTYVAAIPCFAPSLANA